MLENLEPKKVMYYFEEISKIPHGSYNEKAISDYCVAFAKERNLEVWQDDAFNVIIHKPACAGREAEPGYIIQGHLDMVCAKKDDIEHDFKTDSLELIVENGYVRANGTTLGGDDGIAIAYGLAILDSDDISHPDLECVFTTSEEVGMGGASALSPENIHNRRILNIDSEIEGILTVGCAGGARVDISKSMATASMNEKLVSCLTIRGLKGGHSGVEINEGRANAIMLMGRVLKNLIGKNIDIQLLSIDGGEADNAIAKSCSCKFVTETATEEYIDIIKDTMTGIVNEYKLTDGAITYDFDCVKENEVKLLSNEDSKTVVGLLNAVPNGVQKFSGAIKGFVETSLNNGVIKTEINDKNIDIVLGFSVRSSVGSAKEELISKLTFIGELFGAKATVSGEYPGWEYRNDSPLRDRMIAKYVEQYGKEPVVETIHAGLECGLLSEKLPGLDAVSFGPNLLDIHTPVECMEIASVERVWKYIISILDKD